MSFSLILFFIVFVSAEEQSVGVEVDVSDSVILWLYSDGVKERIVGSIITFATVLAGIGVYYLVRLV